MKTTKNTKSARNNNQSISYRGRSAFVKKLVAGRVRDFKVVLTKTRAKFPHSGENRVKAIFKRALAAKN